MFTAFKVYQFITSNSNSEVSNSNIQVENYFFLKNYISWEGAASHNVLYYHHLSIDRKQVSFYANKYFE